MVKRPVRLHEWRQKRRVRAARRQNQLRQSRRNLQMTACHLLVQEVTPHTISVEVARYAAERPERDIRSKVEALRMVARHDKQR